MIKKHTSAVACGEVADLQIERRMAFKWLFLIFCQGSYVMFSEVSRSRSVVAIIRPQEVQNFLLT